MRILPILCFVATVIACGWLWRYQQVEAPLAIGEVHVESVEIKSPCDGHVVSVNRISNGKGALLTQIERGDVATEIACSVDPTGTQQVEAPISGAIVQVYAKPGQVVSRGEAVIRISSPRADYIVCHVPDRWQEVARVGENVALRQKDSSDRWMHSTIQSVGPSVEPIPPHQLPEGSLPAWGLPVQIDVPSDLLLKPGSLVEVSFTTIGSAR